MPQTQTTVAQAVDNLCSIVGALRDAHRGLSFFSNQEVELLLGEVGKLEKTLDRLGQGLAKHINVEWRVLEDYKLGKLADNMEAYTQKGTSFVRPRRGSPGAPPGGDAKRLKHQMAKQLLTGVRDCLVKTQGALMKPQLQDYWNAVKPMLQKVNSMVGPIIQIIPTESRQQPLRRSRGLSSGRRSLSLEAKLRGRLATVGVVRTANRALATSALQERYGPRLAALVEGGNKFALRLVALIERRRALTNSGLVDPIMLERLERPIAKLSHAIGLAVCEESLDLLGMMRLAGSPNSFSSQGQFRNNLTEGLILNITSLASNALAIPSGQYLVWATDAHSTMLVPTSETKGDGRDLLAGRPQQIDVLTTELLGCWNKVERVIGEASGYDTGRGNYENPAGGNERIGRPALKRKVEAAGGVRATAELTGLSPGDVSKHVNNREFEISGQSARAYMRGIGADPDDLYKYGQVKIFDYGDDDDRDNENDDQNDDRNDDAAPKRERQPANARG